MWSVGMSILQLWMLAVLQCTADQSLSVGARGDGSTSSSQLLAAGISHAGSTIASTIIISPGTALSQGTAHHQGYCEVFTYCSWKKSSDMFQPGAADECIECVAAAGVNYISHRAAPRVVVVPLLHPYYKVHCTLTTSLSSFPLLHGFQVTH